MSRANWSIGHLENLGSPWGNAGGVLKTVEEVEKMAKTGVGWIEVGSGTLEKRFGNDRDPKTGELLIDPETNEPVKVYYYDSATGDAANSLGMPNLGVDEYEKQIPEMVKIAEANNKKIVFNFAPVSNDPVRETREGVQRSFEAGAHAVLVNGGCPNVITADGEREEILSLNVNMTHLVLSGLREALEKYNKVFYRVSPQPDYSRAHQLYRAIIEAGTVSAVWVPNSWGGFRPTDEDDKPILGVPGGTGGRTGPATAQASQQQTYWALDSLNREGIDVVRSGGIMDFENETLKVSAAEELKRSLQIGAAAAAGTLFYYESQNGWKDDTHRLLERFEKLY